MDWRRLYHKITLNEFTKLQGRIHMHMAHAKLDKKTRRNVEALYARFMLLHRRYRFIVIGKGICLFFIYLSFLGIATEYLPLISFFTSQVKILTGAIGIPVFTLLLLFLGQIGRVQLTDAHFTMAEILSVTAANRKSI